MVWDKIRQAVFQDKKRKRKNIAKGVAGTAALAGLVATAKRMHEKGYDEKAVDFLKESADALKREAQQLKKKIKTNKKPSAADMRDLKKSVPNMTKDDMKSFAKKEYGIQLSTDDLKKEMIKQFFDELKKR